MNRYEAINWIVATICVAAMIAILLLANAINDYVAPILEENAHEQEVIDKIESELGAILEQTKGDWSAPGCKYREGTLSVDRQVARCE